MGEIEVQQTEKIIELLQWYNSAGVNICLNEVCENRFLDNSEFNDVKEPPGLLPTASQTPTASAAPTATALEPSANDTPENAQALAKSAKSLQELKALLENFDGCALKERASQMVFGSGNPKAKIMIIGKAPGNDEDMLGTPFAGKSGILLDAMLRSICLEREEVFLSNIVPWRPPGNRDPAPQEICACLPFLNRQIELVTPEFIISMGDIATKALMGNELSVLKLDGQLTDIKIGEHKSKIIATLHPQFLLQQPAQKRRVWRDLCNLQRALNSQ